MGEPVAVEVRVEVVQAVQMGFCVPCKTGETGLVSIFPVRHPCDTVAKLSRQCRMGVVFWGGRYCVAVLSFVAYGSALD